MRKIRRDRVAAAGAAECLPLLAAAMRKAGFEPFGLHRFDDRMEGAEEWRRTLRGADAVACLASWRELEALRRLNAACLEEDIVLVPSLAVGGKGLAGPVVCRGTSASWESAWRSVHETVLLPEDAWEDKPGDTAYDLLASAAVNTLEQLLRGEPETALSHRLYMLDTDAMEAHLHPLPSSRGCETAAGELPNYFDAITSETTGIFHRWGETELPQLPLACCLVHPASPLGPGPAKLLSELIGVGMTHNEARLEAGLAGIEAYLSALFGLPDAGKDCDALGAGSTEAEALLRAVTLWLDERHAARGDGGVWRPLTAIEREKLESASRFCLETLDRTGQPATLLSGEPLYGFPVVLAVAGGVRAACAGLTWEHACRRSLMTAAARLQLGPELPGRGRRILTPRLADPGLQPISILRVLEKAELDIAEAKLDVEPFLPAAPMRVVGIRIRGEDVR